MGWGRNVGRGQRYAGPSGAAALHEGPAAVVCLLFKLVIYRERGGYPGQRGAVGGHGEDASARAATRRSISSFELTSVTQRSMPFG